MNSRQKIVVILACLIGGAFIIYPPWTETYLTETHKGRVDYGHAFLWDKPESTAEGHPHGVRIRSSKLSKRVVPVAIIAFVLYIALADKKKVKG